jgi:hypothetical protein
MGCGRSSQRLGIRHWIVRFRAGALLVGMGCLALLSSLRAADKGVDPGLLEFLGSVDTEDKDWHDYLARTDIDQVAKRAGNVRGNSPAPSTPPSAPPVAPASNGPPNNTSQPTTAQPVAHP